MLFVMGVKHALIVRDAEESDHAAQVNSDRNISYCLYMIDFKFISIHFYSHKPCVITKISTILHINSHFFKIPMVVRYFHSNRKITDTNKQCLANVLLFCWILTLFLHQGSFSLDS